MLYKEEGYLAEYWTKVKQDHQQNGPVKFETAVYRAGPKLSVCWITAILSISNRTAEADT